MSNEGRIDGVYIFRLREGTDLLGEILRVAGEEGIGSGVLMVIGRLSGARFGFYLGAEEGYKVEEVEVPVELLSCVGNIALKDGEPAVHAHVVLGDEEGQIYGGHLMEGCTVSPTVELHILKIGGLSLTRHFDARTGLTLLSAKPTEE
ncbi:MAG: PPC domain-containing DNA-binding protein [Candidatus Bathyarchaeia archaeon]